MNGETDLDVLLASMDPLLHDGVYTFCGLDREPTFDELTTAIAVVREAEGTTLVLDADTATAMGRTVEAPMAWITLTVHSSLAAVGLTAAVASRLAATGIACNVVAGFYHDHLFVPHDRAADALAALA